ncbi:NAD(P)-dependent oxidoreductase [Christiangramia sp. SM2212]|uniref:NAD(P)-dependent oxidoreductase n=1 Tax=Christiangramia sediminicola TaxID=3073267 RepID=A0ABU1EPQ8_9FLAO|nr:NAD(P)-dependent oxidoreductase [Christiangramia sp. SM2212]MDR5589959.1 NAD(P)-dependent oxidoreductase [Christiangramia sp. SM2212]
MKFNKIVCVDHTKLNDEAISELQNLSESKVEVFSDYPDSKNEVIERIGNAEAVFVSWHTELDEEIIEACPNLKYIGMACSLYDDESANVAVKFAREKGITVKGIRDYGDPGVAEFIISELIQLLNGYKGRQWKDMPRELTDLKFGIIGLGVTGKLLAECLIPFGVDLFYYSRTRKLDWEKKGVDYLPLEDLLEHCEVLSYHLPKNAKPVGKKEFEKIGNGKILINTSLGLPFKEKAFQKWIRKEGNFAIFDGDGKKELSKETLKAERLMALDASAGWSSQTLKRLSNKVLRNIKDYSEEN